MEARNEYGDGSKPSAATVTPNTSASINPVPSTTVKENQLNMPTELWEKIFVLLGQKDIKSVRLSWRRWTNIASRFLFRTFVFRVDRRDFERFDIVSHNDSMIAGINSLCFEIGTMDIGWVAYQLGFGYMQEYNSARLPSPRSEYTHEGLKIAKDMLVQEYAAWNTRWHEASQNFTDLNKMTTILAKLKSLRGVDISCKATPFTNKMLLDAWMSGSHRQNLKRASKEFVTLLMALHRTSTQVHHLAHDQLPINFFSLKETLLTKLTSSLQHLTTLRLTIDAHSAPHPRCWNGLGKFLCSIPGLKNLRFGFAPFDVGLTDQGTWLHAEDNLAQWYVPLWKMLEEHTWRHLSHLRLDGLMVCEIGLSELLVRHAPTLQCLDLFNLALWSGSFEGLLSSLRSELKLKNFRLWGVVRGFHTPYDAWRLQPTINLDDEVWSPELKAHAMQKASILTDVWKRFHELSSPDISRRLDLFMTPGLSWPWPLHASDALERLIRPPHFRGIHTDQCQQDCVRSVAEINQAWDEGIQRTLHGWTDGSAPETEGIGEAKIITIYDENGFDDGGFNEDGFNEDMVYFMDIYEDWQGAKDPISRYACERMMRESILSQIPRYSQ
ncbi:hypothetical protein L207DRAFT_586815 [Hyaloscypha variabilis F]|uniref:F-box domain-containing protein n=1 Tax=Hyaloscypha variabilis (strain UAMH 11265 / GT02V1 / F) TaxID=1149755 RepID=A0A2J6RBA4_HYAVF|nr:hypothetical protein L207DRAFT_586815 [Hyaloscypha variabilis F]